jgi:hypothetical protein
MLLRLLLLRLLLLPSRGILFSFLNEGGRCSTYWSIPSLPLIFAIYWSCL